LYIVLTTISLLCKLSQTSTSSVDRVFFFGFLFELVFICHVAPLMSIMFGFDHNFFVFFFFLPNVYSAAVTDLQVCLYWWLDLKLRLTPILKYIFK